MYNNEHVRKLAEAIAKTYMPITQKYACLAQAGLECSLFNDTPSELATNHLNFWGLKWREEMAGIAQPVVYSAHDGAELYCKFKSYQDAASGYESFINRKPYQGYDKRLTDVCCYLAFIGPIFCPPGYSERKIKEWGMTYHEKIIDSFLADAVNMIDHAELEPEPEKKLKILLDPGHSETDPGALSPNRKVKEYALNLAQAEYIKAALSQECYIDIYDPNPDDLKDVGNFAKGYDLFISLHHNSFSGTGEPGVEAFTPHSCTPRQAAFCKDVTAKIAQELHIPDRSHKRANHIVTVAASKYCDAYLIESHFMNDETNLVDATGKSIRAAKCIVDVVKARYTREQGEESSYPRWIGCKTFSKSVNIQLSKNFYLQEFACKCNKCDIIKVNYLQIQRLQELRDYFNSPLIIHSAYRCPDHNVAIGGASKSQHMTGRATDFHISGHSLSAIKSKVFELWENGGIGTYSSFFHTDTWDKRRW